MEKKLIQAALEARERSYSPYSNFRVGAAVLADGQIYSGCNIEIASYSPTICAERTAIFKSVSEGHRKIDKIAVVGDNIDTFPCGVCRQVMREFGRDAEIIIANSIDDYRVFKLEEILPHSFGPGDLGRESD